MTDLADGEALPDRAALKGTQRPAFGGAFWFGTFAVFYALFKQEQFVLLAVTMWMSNRSPAIGKKLHVVMLGIAVTMTVAVSVLAIFEPEKPALVAIIFASLFVAAVLPFFLAPTGGFGLELDDSGATFVDWWRKLTLLWSEYEIEIMREADGKVGSIGLVREAVSQDNRKQRVHMRKKRETVFLPDSFGMKREDLADLMRRYRARGLGIPLNPGPYMSASWKG